MTRRKSVKSLFAELRAIFPALDPPIRARFAAPASASAIKKAEQKLGVEFPEDLRALLLCANGQRVPRGLAVEPMFPRIQFGPKPTDFSGYSWLCSVAGIVTATTYYREFVSETLDWPDPELWQRHGPASFHDQYIIFNLVSNPTSLAIDLKPEPGGRVGQVVAINDQPNDIAVLAPDLRAFLELLVTGFQSGSFVFDREMRGT